MLMNLSLRPWSSTVSNGVRCLYTASVLEAARKGTRMKREAKKRAAKRAAISLAKTPDTSFVPHKKKLEMAKIGTSSPRRDDSKKGYPEDDVFILAKYKRTIYPLLEAIELHRETQHPTQFNNPQADLIAHIELSMSADKKNQYVKELSNVFLFPHQFDVIHHRTSLAICTDEEMVEQMMESGVTLALDCKRAIKMADKGELDFKAYDHVFAHASVLPDMVSIRGYLGRKFPSPRLGTTSADIAALARRFTKGLKYEAVKDKYDLDYAKIEAKIGSLDMETNQLKENFKALLLDIEEQRPKTRTEKAITLVYLHCSENREYFHVDHEKYFPEVKPKEEEVKQQKTVAQ